MREVVAAVVLCALSTATFAYAQVSVPSATPAPVQSPTAALTITTRTATVPADVQQALTSARVYDRNVLRQRLAVVNGALRIRTSRGLTVTVDPLPVHEAPEVIPPDVVAKATQIDPVLRNRESYIRSQVPDPSLPDSIVHPQSSVKDQGERSTCLAYASAAALEAHLQVNTTYRIDLSEEHLFHGMALNVSGRCRDARGARMMQAIDVLRQTPICEESAWPYSTTDTPLPTDETRHIPPQACTTGQRWRVTSVKQLLTPALGGTATLNPNNTSYLEAILASGKDIVMGVHMSGTDWNDETADRGVVDIQRDSNGLPAETWGSHAMVIVGYQRRVSWQGRIISAFVLKNSWGTNYARSGYVWVSYNYIRLFARRGYYIESVMRAEPQTQP